MRNIIRRFSRDTSGQFALITAIAAVPLVLCIGLAVDTALVHKNTTGLQTALDSAALAAVIPGNMDDEARAEYAEEVFTYNYGVEEDVDVKVIATSGRVDIQGTVEKQTVFMGISGADKLVQRKKAAAIKTTEEVICLMTLNKTKRSSLTFKKNAQIYAPNCSIQVNSSNQNALVSAGNYKPVAKKICVHGGVNGNLGPNVQANCSYVEDPYEHLSAPNIIGDSACDYGPISFFNPSSFFDVIAVGERGKTRSPGVYCNGLHFYDSEVTLEPGTYVIHNGPLSIGKGSKITGDGVTFVFSGTESYLYTYDEVSLDLKAPTNGPYAGLIFFQDRNSNAQGTSIIKGSANIQLLGTSYFPTQDLFIGGLGVMGANSPAMAFIADNMTLTSDIDKIVSQQESEFQFFKSALEFAINFAVTSNIVNEDYQVTASSTTGGADPGTSSQNFVTTILTSTASHQESGMPPILPRSDGGARLISTDDAPL